jgi:hypothetical protein
MKAEPSSFTSKDVPNAGAMEPQVSGYGRSCRDLHHARNAISPFIEGAYKSPADLLGLRPARRRQFITGWQSCRICPSDHTSGEDD